MILLLVVVLTVLAGRPTGASAKPNVVDSWCGLLGKRLHSVSTKACRAQDFVAAKEHTIGGNSLVMRDIAARKTDPGKPNKRILVIGGIHGDELTSVSTVFRWLEWIDQPDAGFYQWRFIPAANPDGLLAQPSTRVNANGVDLNRNFKTPDWDKDAQKYWIRRNNRDPRRYPGKTAASEIETRWLQEQIEQFRPDLIISVHAPFNLLDYDGPVPKPLRFGRLVLNRLGVYPGSMGNYSGLFKQIPVITIELPKSTIMPSKPELLAVWKDMLTWMRQNLKTASDKPRQQDKNVVATSPLPSGPFDALTPQRHSGRGCGFAGSDTVTPQRHYLAAIAGDHLVAPGFSTGSSFAPVGQYLPALQPSLTDATTCE